MGGAGEEKLGNRELWPNVLSPLLSGYQVGFAERNETRLLQERRVIRTQLM
jgi:hypothetical protein